MSTSICCELSLHSSASLHPVYPVNCYPALVDTLLAIWITYLFYIQQDAVRFTYKIRCSMKRRSVWVAVGNLLVSLLLFRRLLRQYLAHAPLKPALGYLWTVTSRWKGELYFLRSSRHREVALGAIGTETLIQSLQKTLFTCCMRLLDRQTISILRLQALLIHVYCELLWHDRAFCNQALTSSRTSQLKRIRDWNTRTIEETVLTLAVKQWMTGELARESDNCARHHLTLH